MSIVKTFEEWKQTSKYEELLLSLEGQDDCDECCDATGRAAWDAPLPPLDVPCEVCKGTGRYSDHACGFCTPMRLAKREAQLCRTLTGKITLEQQRDFAGEILGKICVYGTLVSGERPGDPPLHAAVDAILAQINRAEAAEARAAKLETALNLALPIMKEDEEVAQRSFLPNPSRYDEELLTRYADAIKAAQAALPATPTQENTHGN